MLFFEYMTFYLQDEPETREAWWNEIRVEMRSHAKALGCHAVLGYSESTTIWYKSTTIWYKSSLFYALNVAKFFNVSYSKLEKVNCRRENFMLQT